MDNQKIGLFLQKLRKQKSLTQTELANILGVTDRAISKWENGRCLPENGNVEILFLKFHF